MTTHDQLITTFELRDHYSGPAQKIINQTHAIGKALGNFGKGVAGSVSSALAGIGQTITNALSNPLNTVLALLTGGALAAGVLGFANSALNMASSFDTIERSFFGVLGSWDQVRSMMDYLKAYTIPSNFGLEPLAQAAALLARNKIDVGAFLPIVEMLALASGQGGSEVLIDAARMLMRLKGGDIAAAFSPQEGIGRFGVSKADVVGQGFEFDANGSFKGSVEEAFDAILKTVKAKLGGIKDAMAGSMEATFSNAATAAQMALATIGKVWFVAFSPILNSLSQFLTNLTQSGEVQKWAENIAGIFKMDPVDNPLVKAAAYFVAALQEIPNIWQYVKFGFMGLANVTAAYFNSLIGNLNTVMGYVNNLINVINFVKPGDDIAKLKLLGGVGMPFSGADMMAQGMATLAATGGRAPGEMIGDRASGYLDSLGKSLGAGTPGIPAPPFTGGPSDAAGSVFDQIAKNTAETAANTKAIDRSQHVFGGGDIGRMGVSAREVNSIKGANAGTSGAGRSDNSLEGKVKRAVELIVDGVMGEIVKNNRTAVRFQQG